MKKKVFTLLLIFCCFVLGASIYAPRAFAYSPYLTYTELRVDDGNLHMFFIPNLYYDYETILLEDYGNYQDGYNSYLTYNNDLEALTFNWFYDGGDDGVVADDLVVTFEDLQLQNIPSNFFPSSMNQMLYEVRFRNYGSQQGFANGGYVLNYDIRVYYPYLLNTELHLDLVYAREVIWVSIGKNWRDQGVLIDTMQTFSTLNTYNGNWALSNDNLTREARVTYLYLTNLNKEGQLINDQDFNWIATLMHPVNSVLSIEILPNLTIGMLVAIPLILGIIALILVFWRKD